MIAQTLKTMNVLGLNSGTSMDGIDAAIFSIGPAPGKKQGRHPALKMELLYSELIPFEPSFKKNLERVISEKEACLKTICLMNSGLGEVFAQAAQKVLRSARAQGIDVDLIGSHGQTIWHEPVSSQFWGLSTAGTLQLGDPAYIAARTGVTTVGDFRTNDVALGGQGAPLVSFADEVIFGGSELVSGGGVGVLNLGGIANITAIGAAGEALMAFDTGPANVLIDEAMRVLFNKEFDADGSVAAAGHVDERRLAALLDIEYFKKAPPKTTGRELFGRQFARGLVEDFQNADVLPQDIIATLTALTARSVALAYKNFIKPKVELSTLVIGGGGEANETLKEMLLASWGDPLKITSHDDFGVTAKFKEALLFALLAYTTYFDIPNNVPACTGATRRVCLGKIVKG